MPRSHSDDRSFDLDRFVSAQAHSYDSACAELRAGRKRGHWMWFIFPQMKGLGHSRDAHYFGIESLAEAEAYLRHSLLGARLRECTRLVNALAGVTTEEIFGDIDAMKFRSSMTLFARTAMADHLFQDALDKYYGGEADPLTLDLLQLKTGRP